MSTPSSIATLVSTIDNACRHVVLASHWVVVVLPDGSDMAQMVQKQGGALFPPGSVFSGRTALLPNGGRVSIVCASDQPFVSSDTPFSVMFVGWGDDIAANPRNMEPWRARATKVLT